jgi:hypothetical protein
MPLKSEKRAAASRANGAKSKGPTTAAGLFRCQTARYDHGLYATRVLTLPGESTEHFEDLRARLLETWAPSGFHAEALVHQLVDVLWEITRVKAVKTDLILEQRDEIARRDPSLRDPLKLNLAAEAAAGVLEKFQRADSRLTRYCRERERLERELYRVRKEGLVGGSSQMSLIINDRRDAVEGSVAELPYVVEPVETVEPEPEPEPTNEEPADILAWAKQELDFDPDPFQVEMMTAPETRLLVLAPRQVGKTAAAAVRAAYEAINHENSLILLASASGRQSGQILAKTRAILRELGEELLPPPPQSTGFTLSNGTSVLAVPDSPETIRGYSAPRLIIVDEAAFATKELFTALDPMMTVSGGTIMLLSTPNGQTGYFYDQWHDKQGPWRRIQTTLEQCPRINKEAIEQIKKTMSKEEFQAEFECRFVPNGAGYISREVYRACLDPTVELFLPDIELPDVWPGTN